MAWIKIPKPNAQNWTNLNPMGKEQYDQVDIAYDSSVTFYDGVNPAQWSNVSKPIGPSWTKVPKPL